MEQLFRSMAKRGKQANLSFFAFTATPKYKTFAIFGRQGEPAHKYTMRQAIEEGFILDVLKHYTTYAAYFKLLKACADDPNVERKKAAQALARSLKLHPHNIAQTTEVMVEHFQAVTRHKIGGRAKAMVVTGSRLEAVRYKQSFDRYIKAKGYKIKSLVAFSGIVQDDKLPDVTYSEEGMNLGIKEKELPEMFATPEYQVLLVAEKYQTGFDQPLLHTMYVDNSIDLRTGSANPLDGPSEVGSGIVREEAVPLSRLIDIVNERFGTDFNQADQLFFDQIVEAAIADERLKQAAAVNPDDKFELVFKTLLETLFVERLDQNEEIFVRFMNDAPFQKIVTAWLASEAYRRLRGAVQ
jgi:hypothetical protein